MNPIDLFIQRPILTWMVVLSLVVFGGLGYARLGVDQFPKMEFPTVVVNAAMEGASPAAQAVSMALPLTYLVDAARRVMIDGAGVVQILPEIALLGGMSLLLLVLAARLFRWD